MFNMGLGEMIVWGAIALIVIGPKQLPEVARFVGRMLNEFKRATGDLGSSIAGVKNQAQSFKHEAESYMHKQKAEFEQAMREQTGLEQIEEAFSSDQVKDESVVPHDPTEDELAEVENSNRLEKDDEGLDS